MDFLYAFIWLIPLYPLLAFTAIVLGLNRNNRLSAGLAIGAMILATLHSWAIVLNVIAAYTADAHQGIHIGGTGYSFPWIPVGTTEFSLGFGVDGLTAVMLFMVPFLCTLIFIYASEYMESYGLYARFFAYVSLFASGMLMLVIANNLLLLFMAWEIMGLCSYLLIGFWFE